MAQIFFVKEASARRQIWDSTRSLMIIFFTSINFITLKIIETLDLSLSPKVAKKCPKFLHNLWLWIWYWPEMSQVWFDCDIGPGQAGAVAVSAAAPDWPGRAEPDSSHHIPAAGVGPEPGAGPVISLTAHCLTQFSVSQCHPCHQ